MRDCVETTGRLAEDRHVARMTTELGDVGPNPSKRQLLIHNADIGGRVVVRIQRRMRQEAKRAQPIIVTTTTPPVSTNGVGSQFSPPALA